MLKKTSLRNYMYVSQIYAHNLKQWHVYKQQSVTLIP